MLADHIGSELHDNLLGFMGEQETLAELAAIIVGGHQGLDLSVAGGGVNGEVDHGVGLLTLANFAHHHFHGRNHDQEFLNLRGNLSRLAVEVLDLGLFLEEEALLGSADEIGAKGAGRGGEEGDSESFHDFETVILIIITS